MQETTTEPEFGSAEWFEVIPEVSIDTTYKVDPTPRNEMDELLTNYVCSTCWGNLAFEYHEKQYYVVCQDCRKDTVGYTSKGFAERRRAESEQELIEAKRNLSVVLGLEIRQKQSRETTLKALGF